ncbi:MAG TPA: hypothetical protein VIQ29_02980 [Ancylobacter sp.]
MYQILGIKRALSYFALVCLAVALGWIYCIPPEGLAGVWRIGTSTVAGLGTVVALFGQTAIFPCICRLPFIRNWFPPIDGKWRAELHSNWSTIQQRGSAGAAAQPLAPLTASVTIIARLFYIRMNLTSENRYSVSKTVFVRASRDDEDGSVMLHYLYRNTTKLPLVTDSDCHDGAANLTVERDGKNIWMDGVYWTNRNWHQGLNTAGTIVLRR